MPLDPIKIRNLLAAKGWSQTDLANKMGVATSNLSRIIAGTFVPKFDTVERLADALDCSVEKLRTK